MNKTNWKRILLFAVVGILIGGGGVAFFVFFRGTPARMLTAAVRSYEEGVKAFEAGNAADASQRLDEAVLRASQAIDALEKQKLTTRGDSPEQHAQRELALGQSYWIKALALRDRTFAEKSAEGKPLTETTDTTQGVKFRSILMIPDAETRDEAFRCMRMAAVRMPEDVTVQQEVLRTEIMLQPPAWAFVETLCENIVAKEPLDTRANFQLAKFHYDQPVIDAKGRQGGPLELSKRSAARMGKAREYLEAVKKSPDHKFWRTRDLEVQLATWLRDNYARQNKHERFADEQRRVRRLLLDEKDGVLAQAAADPKLAELAIFDLKAVLHLYRLALKETVRESREDRTALARVPDIVAAALELSATGSATKQPRVMGDCALGALQVLSEARPYLKEAAAETAVVRKLAEQAVEAKYSELDLYARMARFLQGEARLAKEDAKLRRSLEAEIDQWLDKGLASGRERKLPQERLLDLLAHSGERKALRGEAPTEELAALRQTKQPQALSLAAFLEGVTHERAGRLDRARKLFEESDPEGQSLRANLALSQVYLALGQPEKALQRLLRVSAVYAGIDDADEQDWVLEFLPSKEELGYSMVVARLGAAQRRIADFLKTQPQTQPRRKAPAELYESAEQEARAQVEKLAVGGRFRSRARDALIQYYLSLRRPTEARAEFELASKERDANVDANVELLQLELALLGLEAGGDGDAARMKVEERLRKHLDEQPGDAAGKLLWAMWLMRTDRTADALKYLEGPAFAEVKDSRHQRLLAMALLNSGQRDEGVKLLRHLPSSPEVDAVLVHLAKDETERADLLKKALSRHERNGLLRVLAAGDLLGKDRSEEAAKEYFQALEHVQVRAAAEKGLLRALFVFSEREPEKGRKMIEGMIAEAPTEPSLYLAHAFTSLHLDNLGAPADSWERSQNMATALNVWEQLQRKAGVNVDTINLTRAEFWLRGGRPDLAHAEIRRAYDPKKATIVEILVRLSLEENTPFFRDEGRKQLAILKELQPDSPMALHYEARLLLRESKSAAAVALLEKAAAKHPKTRELHALLCGELLRLKELEKAAFRIAAWQEEFPEDPDAYTAEVSRLALAKDLAGARGKADEFVRLQSTWALKTAKGKEEETAEDRKKRQTKGELSAHWQLARAFVRAGTLDEAQSRLDMLLKGMPELEAGLLLQGEIDMGRKDWTAAVKTYQRILARNPQHFVAGNNLAYILAEHLGEADRAMKIVERLRRGRHTSEPLAGDRLRLDFLDTIGAVYIKANSDGHADMKQLFEDARRRYPADPRLCLYLAHAHLNLGNVAAAQKLVATAITLAEGRDHDLSESERENVLRLAQATREQLEKATP